MTTLSFIKKSFQPFIYFVISLLVFIYADEWLYSAAEVTHYIDEFLLGVCWIFGTLLFVRFFAFVLNHFFFHQTKKELPELLLDLMAILIWNVSFAFFLILGLGIDLSGLGLPTGIAIGVIGFAMRGMLLDLFSGIAMSIERPYDVGDWIEVGSYPPGRVTSMNWRITRIATTENREIVIPNSYIAAQTFTNFNRPQRPYRESIDITLDYDISVEKAERILKGAAMRVEEVANMPKKPDTRIKGFSSRGTEWELRYWLDDYAKRDVVLYEIKCNVSRDLNLSGVVVPPEKHYISTRKAEDLDAHQSIHHLLSHTSLFMPLNEEEIGMLADGAKRIAVEAGADVMKAGEEGASLFIVSEGLVSANIPQEDGSFLKVSKLASGEIFGEISLLTGCPRVATVKAEVNSVVYEISKENLAPVFEKRHDLVSHISDILAERQIENDQKLQEADAERLQNTKRSIAGKLKETIYNIFNLSK